MPVDMTVPKSSGQVGERMLKFKQGGPTVEDAREAMIREAEAVTTTRGGTKVPKFIQRESGATHVTQGGRNPEIPAERGQGGSSRVAQPVARPAQQDSFEIEDHPAVAASTPMRVPAAVERRVAQPVQVQEQHDVPQVTETEHAIVSIFREGQEWVAELSYKNGAGTERFSAASKDALMMKLAVGKSYGTVKVRAVSRRLKAQVDPDLNDKFMAELYQSTGLTRAQFEAQPIEAKRAQIDVLSAAHALKFKDANPELASPANLQKAVAYLVRQQWPITFHNFELAFSALEADEKLEVKPEAKPATPAAPAVSDAEYLESNAAPVAPRKRGGSTGLQPGHSSAPDADRAPRQTVEVNDNNVKSLPLDQLKVEMRRQAALRAKGRTYQY